MLRYNGRRLFLAAGLVMTHSPALRAQPARRTSVIGYLAAGDPEPVYGYFKDGLRKLGYTEGNTLRIEVRSAGGVIERLPALAAELVDLKVAVLVANQTPAQLAAQQVTRQIPIVMAGSADPVGMGLISSLSRPGANITGIAATVGELSGKTLELVRSALPSARRVAVLVNAADPFSSRFLDSLMVASAKMMMELTPITIRQPDDLDEAFAAMARQHIDAVIVQPSLPLRRVATLAIEHRLPSSCAVGSFTVHGGLMSYSPNDPAMFELVARYVDQILKGAKPGDLPVQQPTLYQTSINLKTAMAIGLAIPKSLRLRADTVIE